MSHQTLGCDVVKWKMNLQDGDARLVLSNEPRLLGGVAGRDELQIEFLKAVLVTILEDAAVVLSI